MFENLSDRLERSFKILKGEGKITEINVAETMKDIRRALLYRVGMLTDVAEEIVDFRKIYISRRVALRCRNNCAVS